MFAEMQQKSSGSGEHKFVIVHAPSKNGTPTGNIHTKNCCYYQGGTSSYHDCRFKGYVIDGVHTNIENYYSGFGVQYDESTNILTVINNASSSYANQPVAVYYEEM